MKNIQGNQFCIVWFFIHVLEKLSEISYYILCTIEFNGNGDNDINDGDK